MGRFASRAEAGRKLASRLLQYSGRRDVVVLALPRGGVPVGFEVARALDVPLDVFIVRKLGLPGHEELAIGAIASGGVRVINSEVTERWHIPADVVASVAAREEQELERRERLYRDAREPLPIEGRTVILVDDGLATGSTMRAAVVAVRRRNPARVVAAVPVAARDACGPAQLGADDTVCANTPQPFYAVGLWYEDFTQVEDDEVSELLAQERRKREAAPGAAHN